LNIFDSIFYVCITLLPVTVVAGFIVRSKVQAAYHETHWRSLPVHYGWYIATSIVLPSFILFFFASLLHLLTIYSASGSLLLPLAFLSSGIGAWYGYKNIGPDLCARESVESVIRYMLISAAFISILTTIGIVLAIIFEAIHFFKIVSLWEFLTGTHWAPDDATLGNS